MSPRFVDPDMCPDCRHIMGDSGEGLKCHWCGYVPEGEAAERLDALRERGERAIEAAGYGSERDSKRLCQQAHRYAKDDDGMVRCTACGQELREDE